VAAAFLPLAVAAVATLHQAAAEAEAVVVVAEAVAQGS